MRLTAIAHRGLCCIAGICLLVGCDRIEEHQLLPWFKIQTTTTANLGADSETTKTTEYFVRIHGFWNKLDDVGVGGAIALNDDAVFYFYQGSARLIHKDEPTARAICGTSLSAASVPPGAELIDCVETMKGPAKGIASQVRFRRFTAAGDALNDKAIADGDRRIFLEPAVMFYDEVHTAYFVTTEEEASAAPGCKLMTVNVAEPQVAAGPIQMPVKSCTEPSSWNALVKHQLKRPH